MTKRYLGLDLGGTYIKIAVIEDALDGVRPAAVYSNKVRTGGGAGPGHVRDRLIAQGLKASNLHGPVAGVGIGVPGLFDQATGSIELLPNLPGPWEGFSLRDLVGDGLGMPATMINDARAFTLAEGTVGAGTGASVMLGVTLGTGIGGGIMIDGKLHLGAFGSAGEFGHQTVDSSGPVCGSGNRGCLEAVAKGGVLHGDRYCERRNCDGCRHRRPWRRHHVGWRPSPQASRSCTDKEADACLWEAVTLVKAALGGHAGAIGAALAARVTDQSPSQ